MPLAITGALRLLLGLGMGLVFGVLLHKARVARYEVIVNFFRLKDARLLKVMLSAIVVGAAGIYFFHDLGWVNLHLKSTHLVANIVGGMVMGVGMVMLGYCPGTAVAAFGAGSFHALVGILGGLVGVALYAESYDILSLYVLGIGDLGKKTLLQVLEVSHWEVIGFLAVFTVMLFIILELAGRLRALKSSRRQPTSEE